MSDAEKKPTARPPIRDAATLIIVRMKGNEPEVLMGERSSGHVFFPHHYVFPGGRVERADGFVQPASPLRPAVLERLSASATPHRAQALALAAVRETFEEAGLVIGEKIAAKPARIQKGWEEFYDTGFGPKLDGLTYVYRAVTPAARPRRFNARFFAADYDQVVHDIKKPDGELLKLQWRDIDSALELKIRPITAIVLKEINARMEAGKLHDDDWPVGWVKSTYGGKRISGQE